MPLFSVFLSPNMEDWMGENCLLCARLTAIIWTNYVLQTLVIPLCCVLGIVGNSLAIIILTNPRMKSTFHQSLIALAACDIMFLCLIMNDFLADKLYSFYIILFPYFINPMKNILLCWETFLIMSITTERYLAVCKPLIYRSHKLSHSSKVHLLTYIVPSIFMAVTLNIPKFFETELFKENLTNTENITTQTYGFVLTKLKLDPNYTYYYTHLTKLLCTGIIPFFYLLSINISIYLSIRRSRMMSTQMLVLYTLPAVVRNRIMKSEGRHNPRQASKRYCVTLGAIVVLFLVCNTPRLLLNLLDSSSTMMENDYFCHCAVNPIWLEFFVLVSHLFLVINSAVNFLIYFSLSRRFKEVLLIKLNLIRNRRSSNQLE